MRVGNRRGCKTVTSPSPSKPPSSSICGTWVDLPEPVGAVSTSRFCRVKVSNNAGSISQIGKSDFRMAG
jgi:hypothetical protein